MVGLKRRQKYTFCYYCQMFCPNGVKHEFKYGHRNEPEVSYISRLPRGSKYNLLMKRLHMSMGAYLWNLSVLAERKSTLLMLRCVKKMDVRKLHPCPFCYVFALPAPAIHKCPIGCELVDLQPYLKNHIPQFGLLLLVKLRNRSSISDDFLQKILSEISDPNLVGTVERDPLILSVGCFLLQTQSEEDTKLIPSKLAYLAKVLLYLHESTGTCATLAEYLTESRLELLVTAPVQCGYGEGSTRPGSKRCGLLLLMCMQILRGYAVRNRNLQKNQVRLN